jgi:hypothetical protein
MKLRIAIWSSVGALVVVFWTLYISVTSPTPLGTLWIVACLTCPIALAHHSALSFNSVILINAATYASAGSVLETMRRQYKPCMISN